MMRTNEEKVQAGRDAARRWRKNNPEKVKQQKAAYYVRNADVLKVWRAPGNLARSRALRLRVLMLFGGKCQYCGFSDPRALQVDHKNGGGNQERKILKGTSSRYKQVLADPTRYQLLCANCNWIKREEEQEYRWESGKMAVGVIPRLKSTSTITED